MLDSKSGTDKIRERSLAQRGSSGRGNPLWSIPLQSLTATRERPIFSESRRAPPPTSKPVVQASPPAQLDLALVGAISADNQSIAIFVDSKTKGVIRLKAGESHSGWTLKEVNGRTATLQRGTASTTVSISNPSLR
jgi:general secretion pathway protein N